MTFRQIQDVVLEELGYDPATVSSTPRDRVKRRINEWHRKILTRAHFTRLLRSTYQASIFTTSGVSAYAVPRGIDKINQIYDSTNDVALQPWTHHEMVGVDPGSDSSGVSTAWAVRGWFGYCALPPTSGVTKLYAASSSASDTQVLSIQLVTNDDVAKQVDLTLNGLTSVNVSVNVEEIQRLWLSVAAAGDITVRYDAAAGTVCAVIPAGATTARYLWVRLYPIPSGTHQLDLEGVRELGDLVADHDHPLLPPDFHDILALAAEADEWKRKDDTRYTLCRQECETRLNDLKAWVYSSPEYVIGPDTINTSGSQLGPWFERGT